MGLTALISFDPDFASPAEWAAMYRAAGLQVVPANMPRATNWKFPIIEWEIFQNELIPDSLFSRWYGPQGEHARRINMGMLTGRCSGNIFIIDIDSYKTPAALSWWLGVLAEHNNNMEPETCEQITGGGGRQLLFRAPPEWEAPTNRTTLNVDIRGQGGFAMLPPSIHNSGDSYSWKEGHAPWEMEIANAPDWLLQAVIDLVAKYSGKSEREHGAGPRQRTESPSSDFNPFGSRTNGREEYMRDLIWATIVKWHKDCPIPPNDAENQAKMRDTWGVYERKVKSRLNGEETNSSLLEKEGRGATEFAKKWRYTMDQWSTHVADAAAKWEDKDEKADEPKAEEAKKPAAPIPLQSAFPIKEDSIPPRDWVIPGLFLKRQLSVLVAPPGSGKSLLTLQLAIAVALGMSWGGWTVRKPEKVMVVNAEDDLDEMRRRLVAAAREMGVSQADLAGKIFLAENPESIVIAKTDSRSKTVVRTPLLEQVIKTIADNGIGTTFVDPFAETFEGDENSNSEVKWAGILWREVARRTNSSILLVHHTKKYAGAMAGDADASRGGGALIGTARILSTLFAMTEDEAGVMNVPPENRNRFVRFDDAKANQNLLTAQAKWFEKKSIKLNNSRGLIPGDEVGVLAPWEPPGMLEGVAMLTIGQALDTIDRGLLDDNGQPTGQLYTITANSSNKERWAGTVVCRLFGCDEPKAKRILKEWLKNEVLETFEYSDPVIRKPRSGVRSVFNNRPDRRAS